jgi:hypothetical protein
MGRTSKRIRQTSYHEASHAVIGRVLTLDCGSATIEPDGDSAGHSITNDPWACIYAWERRGKVRMPDAVWHGRIIAYMAGAEGVNELLGGAGEVGDGEDRYQIDDMANQLESSNDDWNRLESRLRLMTRMLVRRHRTLIERVAVALIKSKTLSRDELDQLVGRSVDDVKVNAPFILEMHRQQEAEMHGASVSSSASR